MEKEQPKAVGSGQTTPEHARTPKTVSTGAQPNRSDSGDTELTAIDEADGSVVSDDSRDYPGAPLNSPVTQSVAGDADGVNLCNLANRLNAMPANLADVTPPTSVSGDSERNAPTSTKPKASGAVKKKEFPEHSIWGDYAEEDVGRALQRLSNLAKDEHKNDGSKTVKQYYSERLAMLLQHADIRFDCSMLH